MVEDWNFYQSLLSNTVNHITAFYRDDIISSSEYKKSIDEVYGLYSNLFNLTDETLAPFRESLVGLVCRQGTQSIYEILHLLVSPQWMALLPQTYAPYIYYAHNFFRVNKVEVYRCDDENLINYNQLYTKKNKANTIQLGSNQSNVPTVNKYMCIHKHLFLRTMGAKWFIPYQNQLIVLYGFFSHDHLNTYRNSAVCKEKWSQTEFLLRNLDVPESFKTRFVDAIGFRDFMVLSVNQVGNECLQAYNDIVKIKEKTISQVMKDLKTMSIDKQQRLIEILLMDSDEKESALLSAMIYDFLMTDPISSVQYSLLYTNIHITLQRQLRESRIKINEVQASGEFNEESVSYEKRIQMMKAPDYVKRKALDKWKEVNHSKNGGDNGNAKAMQYLEGLLKVPFGIYKKETIRVKFDELKLRYEKFLAQLRKEIKDVEENNTLSNADLIETSQLMNWCVSFDAKKANPIFIDRFITQLRDWRRRSANMNRKPLGDWIENSAEVQTLIKKIRIVDLRWLYGKLFGETTPVPPKKQDIAQAIIDHSYSSAELSYFNSIGIQLKFTYKPWRETPSYTHIVELLDQIESLWVKYSEYQAKYFRDASSRLDKAVFGIPDAKNQIKRLLAQWINGNDKGYVFGFEGPPGTGKTTLAKQGIAKCLKDENGNPRPFVFIALGGSSNGSTLEGHNYTYVGSTWGRIVDGLIESKCMNPIIYIDELDKISRTEHGREIVGILTHLTDPSQNNEFMDKYFAGIKLDLSKCLIIFSYNDPELIDKILLDRIQRIRLEPLSRTDKLRVSREHVIPEILENIGMSPQDIELSDDDLSYILETFTYEPGMRKGKEKLYDLFREVNLQYLLDEHVELPFRIDRDFINTVFEKDHKVTLKQIHSEPRVGVANAMYATSAGIGGIIQVQSSKIPSSAHLELKLTGSMGDDMKESVQVAKSLALRLLPSDVYERVVNVDEKNRWGIHIHCPSLSVKKSGPSATLVFTVTLLSLFMDEPICNNVSMTGESSLMGKADKIGGVDSKLHGSKKAGVTLSLLPRSNEEDLRILRGSNHPVEDDTFRVILIDDIHDAIRYMFVNGEELVKKVKGI
jgi:ATP-dependent Lon protease